MLVHWDDVEPLVIADGNLRGTRWRLGAAARCARVGLSRYRLRPGEHAMPVHVHGDEEELFYVLAGEGPELAGRAHLLRPRRRLHPAPPGRRGAHDHRRRRRARRARVRQRIGHRRHVAAAGAGLVARPALAPAGRSRPVRRRGRRRPARAPRSRAGAPADDRRAGGTRRSTRPVTATYRACAATTATRSARCGSGWEIWSSSRAS